MNTKHLKAKILDLAIRGKLVPQNSSEGNAKDLLAEIKRNHTDLQISTKSADKKNSVTKKELPPITQEEIPFDIPENWCWCRLNQIADIERGGSPRPIADFLTKREDGINWIKIGDTKKGDKYIENVKEKIIPEGIKHSRLVHAGDFLLTNSMSFGRPYILKVDGCIHDGWLVFGNILSCITSEYLFQLLSSPFIYQSFVLTAAGSTVKNLNIDRVKQVLFPLPPLAEQQRIVCAIEKAFEQIDIIEKNKLNLKTYIKQTKSKVLDLAIHGKLVPQNSFEGNASDLLKEIKRNHTDLQISTKSADKKSRDLRSKSQIRVTKKELPPITQEEIPFDIPENWCWCRLKDVGIWQAGCTPDRARKDFYTNGTIPWLCSGDLTDSYVEKIPNLISQKAFDERKMKLNKAGSVCIAMYGATIGKLGILTQDATTNQAVCVCNNLQATEPKYLFYFLKTHKKEYIEAGFGGAQPNISKEKIEPTLIPLPPLAEQQRIVCAIEKAFEQIDIIEKNKLNLKTYIKQTKSKVLDLAIRGKLVPQITTEGNAFELLKKIRAEKSELIKQKKLKEDKTASFIIKESDGRHYEHFADGSQKDIEDEIPFEIPENWCWTSLEEISISIIAGGDRPAVCSPEKTESNCIPVYANAIAKDGLYGYTNKPQITDKAITISARGTIGFTCIREEPFVPIVRLITLVPNLELIDLKYLKSSFDVLLNMTEGSSIPQLTIPTIKTFKFPLPPLAEQQRIVAKIEQIFAQLNALEKSLGE